MTVQTPPARRRWVRALLALAAVLALPALGFGQYGQPIYPGYQGYVLNPDGSVTMVFQYFSHGRDTVTLPVGPANAFSGVPDRQQPTTFLPGNHEFVCVLVVESVEEAQKLRWSLAYPKEPVSTSVDPLNSEYLLTERDQTEAVRSVDYAKVPRGVCLNKPPKVACNARRPPSVDGSEEGREIEEVPAKLGVEVALAGSVDDEGLPRGSEVVSEWRMLSGPGEAVFADSSAPRTTVTFAVSGTYELELRATDGEQEATDRIRFVVSGTP